MATREERMAKLLGGEEASIGARAERINQLTKQSQPVFSEVVDEGNPFKNPVEEASMKFLIGLFSDMPDLQEKVLRSKFDVEFDPETGKSKQKNVIKVKDSLFVRSGPGEPFKPISPPTKLDALSNIPQFAKIPLAAAMDLASKEDTGFLGEEVQSVTGDAAQLAVPGVRTATDIAVGGKTAPRGIGVTALATGLSDATFNEAGLIVAENMGLLKKGEFLERQPEVAGRALLIAMLTAGVDVAGRIIWLAGKATKEKLKDPSKRVFTKTFTKIGKDATDFLENIRARAFSKEGSRVADEVAEQNIKNYAKGADADGFAKKVSNGLAKSYKAQRQQIGQQFALGRQLSADDIAAKDFFNSQVAQTKAITTTVGEGTQAIAGRQTIDDVLLSQPGQKTIIPGTAQTRVIGKTVGSSLDTALGGAPKLNIRTTDFSEVFTELKKALSPTDFEAVVDHVQIGLKNKIPASQFTGANLADFELNNMLEVLTTLNAKFASGGGREPLIAATVGKAKSAAEDALTAAAATPAAKQFLKARTQLRVLENVKFPKEIKNLMAGVGERGGEIVIFEEFSPRPNKVLDFLFNQSDETQKGLIKGNLEAIGEAEFLNKEAGRVAINQKLKARSAVATGGLPGIKDKSKIANLADDELLIAGQLSEYAGPTGGISGGGEGLKQVQDLGPKIDVIKELGSDKNIVIETDRLNKRQLNSLMFGGSAAEGAEGTSKAALTGLIDETAEQEVKDLLGAGVNTELGLKGAQTGAGPRELPLATGVNKVDKLIGGGLSAARKLAGPAAGAIRFTEEALSGPTSPLIPGLIGSGVGIEQALSLPQPASEEEIELLKKATFSNMPGRRLLQ